MKPIRTLSGRGVGIRRTSIDTDQIIAARHCLRTTRTGFAEHLFSRWRTEPGFPLDDPAHAGATILFAGTDFGTGSSREHAVWALQDYGFTVVVASRFGDIFADNAVRSGLVPAVVAESSVGALMDVVDANPATEVTVDLAGLTIGAGGVEAPIRMSADTRQRFLDGHDGIDVTLRHEAAIRSYERTHVPISKAPGR
ncbi:3-isopropylmalate dehydratase small subunit [Amycolatopsis solani]|uniref:3-isopropylmalate dehydratase small subunit n=1 Tax=Amycolatopsis solani TaxID=3028615 RepID=UPI0025B09999|nr:3-isopropylmalate dehydratase small subunit [Amycolatopsis sp. MEP2-6]